MGEQHKLNDFEPVTYETWLKLVERDLQGAPFEKKLVKRIAGIDVRPLYTRADAVDDGGATVDVYLDLAILWDELRDAQ